MEENSRTTNEYPKEPNSPSSLVVETKAKNRKRLLT
jgi:hypothetical protein